MKAIFAMTILVSAVACLPATQALADEPPQIEVEFLMMPLPVTLGLDDPQSELSRSIANALRENAVDLLSTEFPFIEWIPAQEAGAADPDAEAPVGPIRRLTFVMNAETGIGQRVFIECRALNPAGIERDLDIVGRDVYPVNSNFPTPSLVEATTLANARTVLQELIAEKSEDWEEDYTRKIPLSRRLLFPQMPQKLLLPLMAERLKADRSSEIRVAFRAKVQDEPTFDGELILHPMQPVYESDNEFFGMLVCNVKLFQNLDGVQPGWHELIPIALRNLAPQTRLKVFMHKYVPAEEDSIDDDW